MLKSRTTLILLDAVLTMSDTLERVTITKFKGKIKEYVKDSNIEFVITRSDKPIGVYIVAPED